MDFIEEVRLFIEQECKKSTSTYGYELYLGHLIPTTKYAKILAEKLGADVEVVELAAWLHDIGSIIYGRENHHITGSKIAENKLRELGYPEDKIKEVVHCIFSIGEARALRGKLQKPR